MTHRQAFLTMLVATALWSTAGFASRFLQSAQGFEPTFIRSLFAGLTVLLIWNWVQPQVRLVESLRNGWYVWVSGLCWAAMFTCFMVSLLLTQVANVLVAQSLGPLFTAIVAWIWSGRQPNPTTWFVAIAAGLGIAIMFIFDAHSLSGKHLLGFAIALVIPLAASINWNLVERKGKQMDFIASVFVGAVISAALTLPLVLPFQASAQDWMILSLLGVFQLGLPCALCVLAAKHLAAHETALLTLLEVIFALLLVSWFTNETMGPAKWIGICMVIAALAFHEIVMKPRTQETIPDRLRG